MTIHDIGLLRMGAFLDAVMSRMDTAERRIFVECYIVRDDRLGERLMSSLERHARRGIDVRLLYDPSGSHRTASTRFRALAASGVKVRPYGIFPWMGRARPGFRDHARAVLVDDVAFTGGHAWGDEWLPKEHGGGGWHDMNCVVRGPMVEDWAQLLERRWDEASLGWPVGVDTGDRHPDVRLISDAPAREERLVPMLLDTFGRAQCRIWIANAYYFPSRRFRRALREASARGVDVRAIAPGPTDLPIVRRAARADYRAWLESGIRVFEYQPAVFHGKYAIVDDDWCTVGSYNAITTSVHFTVETNVVCFARAVVNQAARMFEQDVEQSREITLEDTRELRLRARLLDRLASWTLKVMGRLIGVFAWFTKPASARRRRTTADATRAGGAG